MKKRSKRRYALLLGFLLLTPLLFPLPLTAQAESGLVTVYFPNWNVYSSPSGQVKDLPWSMIDCVYHAFWKIVPEENGYAVRSTDPWADTDPANPKAHFPQYREYAGKYPQAKILLSIGGWTCSGYFSQMAAAPAGRASFIQSCVDTLNEYPFFSGIDLDWEYPGAARRGGGQDEGNPVVGDDKANYTLLLKEMRAALDERFGKGEKQLTVCASASVDTLARQDYEALFPYVDRINVMSYDLSVSPTKLGHHTALYGASSADKAVKYLQNQGVPASKIILGTPLYSHGWKMASPGEPKPGAAAKKVSGGEVTWRDLAALEKNARPLGQPGWHAGYDEEAKAAYLWNDDSSSKDFGMFYSYESSRSLSDKLTYIRVHCLGGIVVWESGGDSAKDDWPMIRQMHASLQP